MLWFIIFIVILICFVLVNLIVLLRRLIKICLRWVIFFWRLGGMGVRKCWIRVRDFCWVFGIIMFKVFFRYCFKLKGYIFRFNLLALILEKFKILLIKVSRVFLLLWMVWVKYFCWVVRFVFSNNLVMLMMVFMGVWILWFMVVKNLFLDWLVVFVVVVVVINFWFCLVNCCCMCCFIFRDCFWIIFICLCWLMFW